MRSKIVARLWPVKFVLLPLLVFASTDKIAAQSKDVLDGAKSEGQLVFLFRHSSSGRPSHLVGIGEKVPLY